MLSPIEEKTISKNQYKMKKIAIIGAGNMGSAIAASLEGRGYRVVCTAATSATLEKLAESIPFASFSLSNAEAAEGADIVVLAVKPYIAPGVIEEIRGSLKDGAVIVSVIAALSIAELAESLSSPGKRVECFRVIPNTAIRYGKSVTFISHSPEADKGIVDEIESIFNLSGESFIIPEKDMGACTALASCGIAYFLRFIRAAAEGSVELGLRAGFATKIAVLTAEGAAALLKGGSHPEAEIDKVTTPGGITIRGLNALEDNGFTKAAIAALRASVK